MKKFGNFIKSRRKALLKEDPSFSQQQLSEKIGIKQSYLSKIERGSATTLSEEKVVALAGALDVDPDYLLALGGKVSQDVLGIIKQRPRLFSRLVRDMKNMPEDVIEADHEFKQRQSRISRLYSLAGIAFFHLEDAPGNSVWSDLTPSMLNLPSDAEPSLEAIRRALSQTSHDYFITVESKACKKREPYTCELQLKDGGQATKYINVWGDYEIAPDGDIIRIGLIQDVTKTVLVRTELNEAKYALSGTVEEQSQQVIQGINKLKKEIAARKILEAELRGINADVARKKDFQRNFFKKSAYQLRSLVNRLALEEHSPHLEGGSPWTLNHISTAINNLNDFFEMEDGVQPLHDNFDPAVFFETAFADIQDNYQKPSITTQLNLSPNLPRQVTADQQRLQQIIDSVMGSLIPSTLWGCVQGSIDYLREEEMLILQFSSSATCEPINKERFYPLGNLDTESPTWKLTTIGPIIDGLKGILDIKPTPSNGVDIVIQIPVAGSDSNTSTIDKKQSVLVVEDDEFSRLYTERTVSKLGFEVESVATGKEAIERAKSQAYGLILLDIQLPDADGVTVAKEIRKNGGFNQNTRIIAVTAHATSEDRRRYENAGINQFIAKPFKIDMLAQVIGGKGIS